MSRRSASCSWSNYVGVTTSFAAAAGLGYALYRAGDDETHPVNAVLNSRSPNSCSRISPNARSTEAQCYSSSSNRRSIEQERTSPCYRRSPQASSYSNSRCQPSKGKSGGCQVCYVCKAGIGGGHAFILPCCHTFHDSCIAANYAYKVLSQNISPEYYSCPACRSPVTEDIIELIENLTLEESDDYDDNMCSTRAQRQSVCGSNYGNYY